MTYLYNGDEPLLSRVCAGIIIGQILFSLVGCILGCVIGMNVSVVILSALLSALPAIILLFRPSIAALFKADVSVFNQSAKEFLAPVRASRLAGLAIYFFLFVFLWLFYDRAMVIVEGGIGTGSLHNYGDISFHLQAIYGFLDGQNYPPQNPSFAGAKFTYPFMADLVTAMFAIVGARISEAMFWQNLFLTVALVGVMHRFTFKLTSNKFAAQIAPFVLLFSGGLGFLLFFSDALTNEAGLFASLFKMPDNYTIRPETTWRWGNSLTALFMTQRSMLLGLPLALIVFTKVWEIFSDFKFDDSDSKTNFVDVNKKTSLADFLFSTSSKQIFAVGLLAGALPLVHAHSFAVVMGMTGCLALINWQKWPEWTIFFLGASVVSVPELLWAMLNSASKPASFIDWQFGWDNLKNINFFYFWFKNTGLFIPLLIAAIIFLLFQSLKFQIRSQDAARADDSLSSNNNLSIKLLLFWLPFALCFIVPNAVRLAPWIWDNVKVLIYWFTISIPLVAFLLAQIWQSGKSGKALTAVLLVSLTLSGWLDVWRVASKQMEYQVFTPSAVTFARAVRQKLPPDAIVMSAPTFNSPAALMGRRWFLGFTTHLWSHGIDAVPRETDLKEIYFGSPNAERLLSENKIDYIVLSPQESEYTVVNQNFLRRFPVVVQEGEFRLLRVK